MFACMTAAAAENGDVDLRNVGAPLTLLLTIGEDVTSGACVDGASLIGEEAYPCVKLGIASTERRLTSCGDGAPITRRRPPLTPPPGAPPTLLLLGELSPSIVLVKLTVL